MPSSIRILAVLLLLAPGLAVAHPSSGTPAAAAQHFLESLSLGERQAISYPFDARERFAFRWTPGRRSGIPLKDLSDPQREHLAEVLRSVLSEHGIWTVDAIIATEAALAVVEGRPSYRDPELYYTTLFGAPGEANGWGLRFEGHHLSVNLTFEGDRLISATPLFLGANPATVRQGPDAGLRALGDQTDLAFALLESLSDAQRREALGSREWFGGFLTSAGQRRADLGEPAGVSAAAFNAQQRALLEEVIASYVRNLAPGFADPYMAALIAEEMPALHFYWRGSTEPGDSYYYRIAGKRLLIEHEARSNGNHIHAIWRDAEQDWGERQ